MVTQVFSSVERSAARYIICERCGCEYWFVASAKGSGRSSTAGLGSLSNAHRDAADFAMIDAHRKIAAAAAPCPDCGWYQRSMIKGMRQRHHGWLRQSARALLVIAVPILFVLWVITPAPPPPPRHHPAESHVPWWLIFALASAVIGASLLFIHRLLASRYHPNQAWPKRAPTGATSGEVTAAAQTPEHQQRLDAASAVAWYYIQAAAAGRRCGPTNRSGILALLGEGKLALTDQVWREGMDAWQSAEEAIAQPV